MPKRVKKILMLLGVVCALSITLNVVQLVISEKEGDKREHATSQSSPAATPGQPEAIPHKDTLGNAGLKGITTDPIKAEEKEQQTEQK